MNSVSETDQGRLVLSQWKNTAEVYSSPEAYIRGGHVPSLVWFCLQCISEYPDQIQLPLKLVYRPSIHRPPKSFRFLDKLLHLATMEHSDREPRKEETHSFSNLDPRLWAAIVQIFNDIPQELRTYTIPLNDEFLPLLQGIQNTDTFSLVTILELPGCLVLADDSIAELGFLHGLVAFDASRTKISASGILSLSRTLRANDTSEAARKLRGPWGLRILRLKRCEKIGDAVFETLPKFPLLSVVDLRGTACSPPSGGAESAFSPIKNQTLFSSDLALSLSALQQHEENVKMFSAPPKYQVALRIKTLCHERVASVLPEAKNLAQSRLPDVDRTCIECDHGSYDDSNKWCDGCGPNSDDFEVDWNHHECTDIYDSEHSREGTEEEGEEQAEWQSEGLLEEEDACDSEGEYHPASRQVNKNSYLNEMAREHTLGSSPRDSRPPKRQRTTVPVSTGLETALAKHSGPDTLTHSSSPTALNELESDSDPSLRSSLISKLAWSSRDRRKPHWYDADWERENTYVPLNQGKGKYDNKLTLYRPMRPWSWLDKELDIVMAREKFNKEARAKKNAPLVASVAPNSKKGSKAWQGLSSMVAVALQRRNLDDSQSKNEVFQNSMPRNPFRRKSATPSSQGERNVDAQPVRAAQSLKPISSLQVPEFTQDLLQRSTAKELRAQGSLDNKNTSTSRNHKTPGLIATVGPLARGPSASQLKGGTDVERREHQKRHHLQVSEAQPTTSRSTPSQTAGSRTGGVVKPKGGGGKDGKAQPNGFDWTAWTSKRR